MSKRIVLLFFLLVAGVCFANQDANDIEKEYRYLEQQEEEEPPSIDKQLLPFKVGPVRIGGAFRFNYSHRTYDEFYDEKGQFDLDTLRVNADLVGVEPLIGSFEYRWYIPRGNASSYNFLHHGWLGYELNESEQIQAGVHQVPFGILPYASHNWFFQLPYYLGLEDDYDLGFKYIKDEGAWNWQFAYYPSDEGHYNGDSKDSARYSYDIVEADFAGFSTFNEERHQFNARTAYTFEHSAEARSELGLSLQYGLINNDRTDYWGSQYAVGLHLDGYYGKWNTKLEAIRYEMNVDNQAGVSEKAVSMGAYDFPYRVAADGTMLVAGVSRDIPVNWGKIQEITVYNDFSVLLKDESSFKDTYQNVLGMSFALDRFFVYVDMAMGKRHPWFGGDWTNGLADGGSDSSWNTRFNVNVGYYF